MDRTIELFEILAQQSPEAYNPVINQIKGMRENVLKLGEDEKK